MKFLSVGLMLLLLAYHQLQVDCQGCVNSSIVGKYGGECQEDWIRWRNHCYKVISDETTWIEARERCAKTGAFLVVPLSTDETRFLLTLFRSPKFWIDCNDMETEGQWVCQEGDVMVDYREWRNGEPDNNSGEHCATAWWEGWNDVSCSKNYPAVCRQKPPMMSLQPPS